MIAQSGFCANVYVHPTELPGILLGNRDLTFTLAEGDQGPSVAVGCALDSSGPQLRGLLMAATGVLFGRWSLTFGGSAVNPDEKSSSMNIYFCNELRHILFSVTVLIADQTLFTC